MIVMERESIIVPKWQKDHFGNMSAQENQLADILLKNNEVIICNAVINDMLKSLINENIEQGGIIGARNGMIVGYHHDKDASCSMYSYRPDFLTLNRIISSWFYERQIIFKGFVHTHPYGCNTLSVGDLNIMRELLEKSDNLTDILALILEIDADLHRYRISGYSITYTG